MSSEETATPIPVTVITGFLGSGKTTLLQHLLQFPELSDTAVLINEFGEIGLDHHLVRQIDEDVVVLASGCLCCTIRDDLGKAMRDLLDRRTSGELPPFARLLIETTGLADPVPILHTLLTEPVVDQAYQLRRVVTAVDAVNGDAHLARQPESAKQAAVADRIVITKTDLASANQVEALRTRLKRLNPSAAILTAPSPHLLPDDLLAGADFETANKPDDVRAWLDDEAYHDRGHQAAARSVNRHDDRIAACCLVFEEPIDWSAFCLWLTMLLHAHGPDVLRVKGLIDVPGHPGPVVINGVQHIVHPPIHLERWGDSDHRSRIVFITRDIPCDVLKTSLRTFNHAALKIENLDRDLPGEIVASGAGRQIGGRPFRRAGAPFWMK